MNLVRQVKVAGLIVGLALTAMAVLAFGHTQANTSLAGGNGTLAVDCDGATAGVQADCFHAPGSSFSVEIHVTAPPTGGPPTDGYYGFQSKLTWTAGVNNYAPTATPGEEALWPNCDIPARSEDLASDTPYVLHGCVPLPALTAGSTITGAVLSYAFSCKADPVPVSPPPGVEGPVSVLTLIPQAGDPNGGSHFLNADSNTVDPLLVGATITCEAPPVEPTPTPGGEATPTPEACTPGPGVTICADDTTPEAGSSTTLTITVLDDAGNPVADAACTVSVTTQPGTTTSVSPTAVTTDANGEAEVTLNAGTTVGDVEVSADCGANGTGVLAVEVVPAGLPPTGIGAAAGDTNAGLWAIIGLVLAAAAAGLALSGWRYARTRA